MKDISITYSIYGNFDLNRLLTSLKSVLCQNKSDIKVIISEENLESQLEGIDKNFPVVYLYSKPIMDAKGDPLYNPGKIRNRAVMRADCEFIYLNDGDIVFQNQEYLNELVREIHEEEALIWPPCRRLIESDVARFIKLVEDNGIIEALHHLKYPNEYVANLDGSQHDLKAVTHNNGRVYTTELSTFQRYLSDKTMKGKEPTFWHDVVHIGGIFARRDLVLSVGGYTESYITWGYEDVDLQWKLREMYSTRIIPPLNFYEVLHLDHPKNYFSQEYNKRNKKLFERRQSEGLEKAIENDLKKLK